MKGLPFSSYVRLIKDEEVKESVSLHEEPYQQRVSLIINAIEAQDPEVMTLMYSIENPGRLLGLFQSIVANKNVYKIDWSNLETLNTQIFHLVSQIKPTLREMYTLQSYGATVNRGATVLKSVPRRPADVNVRFEVTNAIIEASMKSKGIKRSTSRG